MKKVLLIAAVALCAMSCGNKNAKCCEGSCCDSTAAATEEVVVVEEDTTAADSAVVVEEVVEEYLRMYVPEIHPEKSLVREKEIIHICSG